LVNRRDEFFDQGALREWIRRAEPSQRLYRSSAMPRTATLHGSAPDESTTALLIVDLISDFAFEDGDRLARTVRRIVGNVARLAARARKVGIPVIYVNDNRGRWRSDRTELIARCTRSESMGRPFVEQLAPEEQDYFIFKPKHSGFFATPLAALLEHLGTHTVILTGVTAEQCILFTAMDAYVRDYEIMVPRDCVAGLVQTRAAMTLMESILKAKSTPSPHLRLPKRKPR
jgi:nicotinamidase-related amidase